jgi:hypothetical protein
VDWIHLAQDTVQWVVSTVMNLRALKRQGISFISKATTNLSRMILLIRLIYEPDLSISTSMSIL